MPSEDTETLDFSQCQESNKATFIIYADLENIIEKIDGCKNTSEIYLQQKQVNIFHHVFEDLQYLFRVIENQYDVYRIKGCMKKFCEFSREHTVSLLYL